MSARLGFARVATAARHSLNASAVSRARIAKPPNPSSNARCIGARASAWCACCPCKSTSISPISPSCASVAGRPLIQARERPCASSTRRSSTTPGSPASPCASSHASTIGRLVASNTADNSARSAPWRNCRNSKRSPSSNASASTSIDLPAPVSPVSTVKPGSNSTSSFSTTTKLRIDSACSIAANRRADQSEAMSRGVRATSRSGVSLQCSFSRSIAK